MTDTTPDVDARVDALLRERTPTERLRMATGMFATARMLMIAGIRAQYGSLSDTELRRVIVTRLYGDDLGPEAIDRVAGAGARPWVPGGMSVEP